MLVKGSVLPMLTVNTCSVSMAVEITCNMLKGLTHLTKFLYMKHLDILSKVKMLKQAGAGVVPSSGLVRS